MIAAPTAARLPVRIIVHRNSRADGGGGLDRTRSPASARRQKCRARSMRHDTRAISRYQTVLRQH